MFRQMRTTIALTAVFLSSCIHLPKQPQYDTLGNQIAFISTADVKGGAQAGYNQGGRPFVEYDSSSMRRFPEEVQMFIFGHEIGHIILGHGAVENLLLPEEEVNNIEREADCYSVRRLEDELHYTSIQIEIVQDHVSKYFGKERAKNMLKCVTCQNRTGRTIGQYAQRNSDFSGTQETMFPSGPMACSLRSQEN